MKFLLFTIYLISNVFFGQEFPRDTLLINYDESLLTRDYHPKENKHYLRLNDKDNKEDIFYFLEENVSECDFRNSRSIDLLNLLIESKSISSDGKIDDYKFFSYLNKKKYKRIIILKENECIRVQGLYEIE